MVRRNRSRRHNTRTRFITKRRFHALSQGRALRVNADPPKFAISPWWPIVIYLKIAKDQIVSPKDIWGGLTVQLPGLKPKEAQTFPAGNLRILSVRAWCLEAVNLTIYDVGGNSKEHMFRDFYDLPAKNLFAKVGWTYGDDERQTVHMSSDNETRLFAVSTIRTGTIINTYVQVLVKFEGKSVQQIFAPQPSQLTLRDMEI